MTLADAFNGYDCEFSLRLLRRFLRYAVVNFANDNRPEPTT